MVIRGLFGLVGLGLLGLLGVGNKLVAAGMGTGTGTGMGMEDTGVTGSGASTNLRRYSIFLSSSMKDARPSLLKPSA